MLSKEMRVVARVVVVGAVTGGIAALLTRYIEHGAKRATGT